MDARLRMATLIGLAPSLAAIWAWYAPHQQTVQAAGQIENGVQINPLWIVTAPIDQVLLPALIWIEGRTIVAGASWLPFVVLAALVMGSSPLLRARGSALILCAGPLATVAALSLTDAYLYPRFLSFLLVPLFVLLASGGADVLARIPTRGAIFRTAVCLVGIAALAVHFALLAPEVVGLPREANRDAAEVIRARSPRATPVYGSLDEPGSIEFYLRRPVRALPWTEVVPRVCDSPTRIVFVRQIWAITLVKVPCLDRNGVDHYRFRQYARSGRIDVWFVPPGR
jgi:hypothetical protein